MPFVVKTDSFEGPLDKLLSLIEKRELFIGDISLSKVTDEFVEYVNSLPYYNLSHMSEYVLVASTLILIKSKFLLPNLSLTPEEEQGIEELENRLNKLQKIHNLSKKIMLGKNVLYRRKEKRKRIIFSPTGINVEKMANISKELLNAEKEERAQGKVKRIISLEEVINRIKNEMQAGFSIKFNDFVSNEKVVMIVNFLALLELVKQGVLTANQKDNDILMESLCVKIPKYI